MNLLLKYLAIFLFSTAVYADSQIDVGTILYIGDSHSYGAFGTVLEKNLSTLSSHVVMESSCGSSADTWLGKTGFEKTVCGFWKKDGDIEIRSDKHLVPKLSFELENYQPSIVIVQLGTNMAVGTNPVHFQESINRLMKLIKESNSKCIWIGPPDANSKIVTKENLKIINGVISALAVENNCEFIDSLKITNFPLNLSEGIHYPNALSSKWGDDVSKNLINILKN
jgi:hypothetical protein